MDRNEHDRNIEKMWEKKFAQSKKKRLREQEIERRVDVFKQNPAFF